MCPRRAWQNLRMKFTNKGLIAMANGGPNTNGSQFFITTAKAEHLNFKSVGFGEVLDGYEVVQAIESLGAAAAPQCEGTGSRCGMSDGRITGTAWLCEVLVSFEWPVKPQDYFISDGFLFFNHPTDGSGCCTAEALSVEEQQMTWLFRFLCSLYSNQPPRLYERVISSKETYNMVMRLPQFYIKVTRMSDTS
ncbi:E3 SUMO-protein ligase RanBP2 (Ran-binding protein 2) (RanBP2) [Durusdinium trenchii]|uniref:Peptidyl-prolyl cis-trans isomerase n=1 Tax=Durusdinium trenchii TaxID=1381693 RepID=A0ABP0L0A7_9DINO